MSAAGGITVWVGLIRNVMIGRRGLHRDTLLALAAASGAGSPHSHLATGNLTFLAAPRDIAEVRHRLETAIESVIGQREPVVIRSHEWLKDFVSGEGFAGVDVSTTEIEVSFLPADGPMIDRSRLAELPGARYLVVADHELAPARRRDDRMNVNRLAERASDAKATARAWSTLLRLARYEPPPIA